MFLDISYLPYSFYSIMIDDMFVVDESYAFRPDRVVSDYQNQGMSKEILCNVASNSSPLSLSQGSKYLLPSQLFNKYFFGV